VSNLHRKHPSVNCRIHGIARRLGDVTMASEQTAAPAENAGAGLRTGPYRRHHRPTPRSQAGAAAPVGCGSQGGGRVTDITVVGVRPVADTRDRIEARCCEYPGQHFGGEHRSIARRDHHGLAPAHHRRAINRDAASGLRSMSVACPQVGTMLNGEVFITRIRSTRSNPTSPRCPPRCHQVDVIKSATRPRPRAASRCAEFAHLSPGFAAWIHL